MELSAATTKKFVYIRNTTKYSGPPRPESYYIQDIQLVFRDPLMRVAVLPIIVPSVRHSANQRVSFSSGKPLLPSPFQTFQLTYPDFSRNLQTFQELSRPSEIPIPSELFESVRGMRKYAARSCTLLISKRTCWRFIIMCSLPLIKLICHITVI